MKIRKDFFATRDIDWFCLVNGVPLHAASAGGVILPDLVNDTQKLRDSQYIAYNLPDTYENVFINSNLIRRKLLAGDELKNHNEEDNTYVEYDGPIFEELSMEDRIAIYASSFVSMSKKGFFSFDRSDLNDPESTTYDLISFPVKENFKIENLVLPTTQLNVDLFGDFNTPEMLIKNISLFEGIDLIKLIH